MVDWWIDAQTARGAGVGQARHGGGEPDALPPMAKWIAGTERLDGLNRNEPRGG
jgi:hypothetical protein